MSKPLDYGVLAAYLTTELDKYLSCAPQRFSVRVEAPRNGNPLVVAVSCTIYHFTQRAHVWLCIVEAIHRCLPDITCGTYELVIVCSPPPART